MPNRIIKETICTSDSIDNLSWEEEVFFYRLIVNCDDYGRMDGRPAILRAKLYPLKLDRVKEKDIDRYLSRLVENDLILHYMLEDRPYIQLATWDKHQQIRAKRSKYPSINDNGIQITERDSICKQMNSSDCKSPRNPIQSESESNPNTSTKLRFADNVTLTQKERDMLAERFGEQATVRMIEILDNYKGANGKKYRSDYKAILNWVTDRYQKEQQTRPGNKTKTEQSLDELERLAMEYDRRNGNETDEPLYRQLPSSEEY